MRLIDADCLKEKGRYDDFDVFVVDYDDIKNAPTIDPVKHGRWVDRYDNGDWHCSLCGAIVEEDEQTFRNWYYCYHCGAKMDGKNDETRNV